MKSETQADFVLGMNPDHRLFVARMQTRGFVDQRLIRLTIKSADADMDLLHALLNSTLSLFLIEASGFGRGLGALDLTSTKIKRSFAIWNPSSITGSVRHSIMEAFAPLNARAVLPLEKELERDDRIKFDSALCKHFGLLHHLDDMYGSLLHLYQIRQSVRYVQI